MRELLLSSGKVNAPSSLIAEAGYPLTFGCNITTSAGDTVRQVRWLNSQNTVVLAYEQSVPLRISRQDPGVQLFVHFNDASYITIKKVQPEDEGCYSCVFDIFPTGSQKGKTCITVTGEFMFSDASDLAGIFPNRQVYS